MVVFGNRQLQVYSSCQKAKDIAKVRFTWSTNKNAIMILLYLLPWPLASNQTVIKGRGRSRYHAAWDSFSNFFLFWFISPFGIPLWYFILWFLKNFLRITTFLKPGLTYLRNNSVCAIKTKVLIRNVPKRLNEGVPEEPKVSELLTS